jgi:predicted  nucleic acid-binding Zn-ribbon protein
MAEPVPAGSDVSAGTYECTNCGKQIDIGSTKHLPPCPSCGNGAWSTVSGGDAVDDPYPGKNRSSSRTGGPRDRGFSAVGWLKDKTGLSRG